LKHIDAPAALDFPAAQGVHDGAPAALLNVPALQAMHELEDCANVPAGQLFAEKEHVVAPAMLKEFTGQPWQLVAPFVELLKEPAEHGRQVAATDA